MAARLDLQLDRPRKPYLVWGPFSIDFAIDLIEIAGVSIMGISLFLAKIHVLQQHSQDIGRTERILMPNATTLQSIHRADLIEKASIALEASFCDTPLQIEMYGGFVDVARRIGMDPE